MKRAKHHGASTGPFYDIDTPYYSRSFADLRSATRPIKRGRDDYHKYFKYEAVNWGQRTSPHLNTSDRSPIYSRWPADVDACEAVSVMPKRDYYDLAMTKRICNHHSPCPYKKDSWRVREVEFKRGTKEAHKDAEGWEGAKNDLACARGDVCYEWLREAEDEWMMQVFGEEDDISHADISMAEVILLRGPCFVVKNDLHAMSDDDGSVVSAFTADEGWDVWSVDSWEDDSDVGDGVWVGSMDEVEVLEGEESEWSEVEG